MVYTYHNQFISLQNDRFPHIEDRSALAITESVTIVPGPQSKRNRDMSDEVKIGIIGVGNMGKSHAHQILDGKVPGAKLTAICDYDQSKLDAFKDTEGVAAFSTSDEFYDKADIDAVIIATPHYDHTPLSVTGFEKNLHVLVEKPLAVHVNDAKKTIAAYENRSDKSKIFAEMFNQRCSPLYRKLKDLLEKGELGEIRRVNWIITDWFRSEAYYASGGWRATWAGEGGGVLVNQCPHQLDLIQWLFGMPSKVRAFASCGQFHNIEVEDNVTAYLEYPNGATGVFIATTGEAPGTNRLEVAGEMGKIVIEGGDIQFIRNEVGTLEHSRTTDQGFGGPATWDVKIPIRGDHPQHNGILRNFVNAILNGEELIASGVEGINGVELCNAMLFSAFEDVTVELPVDGDAYEAMLKKKIENSTFEKGEVKEVHADMSSSF